jgi:uncharacterized protein (TIGR02996 family)
MHTDADFLSRLLENPADDVTRLVYSDWLDEQGDTVSLSKSEFLRVTVELVTGSGKKGWRKALRKRLQQLAAPLDTDWLAVVSRLAIENCHKKSIDGDTTVARTVPFEFLCSRRWEDLTPTDDHTVRSCDSCKQNVHYCDTITEARDHAAHGHCIAVDLGVIRREGDLAPRAMWLGRPSVESLRREEERMKPDAVSAEREQRKRNDAAEGQG